MIPGVAAAYETAARSSQRVEFRVQVVGWSLGTIASDVIPVSGGSLKVANDRVRRTGKIEIITDGSLVPGSTAHVLHPYRHNYLGLSAIVTAEAGTFTIPLAAMRVGDLDVEVTPGGSKLTATCSDDAYEAIAGRIWPGAANVEDRSAEALETRVARSLSLMYDPTVFVGPNPATGVTVPAGQIALGPKIKAYPELCDLVEGYGYRLGPDYSGVYRLTPGTAATAGGGTFYFGGAGARTATIVRQSWSVRDLVNSSSFLVNSSEQGTTQGVAYDNSDPLIAPTTSGRWGQRWTTAESRDVAAADANAAAARALVGTAGGSRRVTFSAVPDYRMEGGDKVVLDLPAQKVVGTFIVESVEFALVPGALMNVTCQEVRGA